MYTFVSILQSRECVLRLSSSECVLKREVEEGRDALEKMAALNSALASDKRELHKQLLEVPLLALPLSLLLLGSKAPEHEAFTLLQESVYVVPGGVWAVRQTITAAGSEVRGQLFAERSQNF